MRLVITGAAGFIGLHLCKALRMKGFEVVACVREPLASGSLPAGVTPLALGDLAGNVDLDSVFKKGDVVVHLAGRAHVLKEKSAEPFAEFRAVNLEVTKKIALACARKGVSRFVFLSSIGVNGGSTTGRPFSEADAPAPEEPYAVSKWEAEQELAVIGREQGLPFTIIRPPLVYGPENPGNFLRLLRLAASGLPLPLASFGNIRSMIFVGNLTDAVILSMQAPAAVGKTYIVSDGEDVSTAELLRLIREKLGAPSRLFRFPAGLVRVAAGLSGFGAAFEKLTSSLVVDRSRITTELGWKPPFSFSAGLTETVEWYKNCSPVREGGYPFKRTLDVVLSLGATLALSFPMLLLSLFVKLTSRGPALYLSDRIGRDNVIFKMPKFRTMRVDTPPMATHLMTEPEKFLTPIGAFLRKTSLDELPQLFSILRGDMSFVGPRPALFNQEDLIALRTSKGTHRITPGLTGWAQVNGRDDLSIPAKVGYDEYYKAHQSFTFDLRILAMTALQALRGKGVKH